MALVHGPIRVLRAILCLSPVIAVVLFGVQPGLSYTPDWHNGSGHFRVAVPIGGGLKNIPVYYHRPGSYGADTPIVFVLHGLGRNARGYRDAWAGLAEKHNLLVVAPEFSKSEFPKARHYNLGNVFAHDGQRNPPDDWSFAIIDRLFARLAAWKLVGCTRYSLYGHSAGGQFVHRMVMLSARSNIDIAVAANAGWYTLPSRDASWPYGLRGAPIDAAMLRAAFARKLIILLGGKDNDPAHKHLRRTPEAMEQGSHRLDRGRFFMAQARDSAARFGVPFAWEKHDVPSAGHSNRQMAGAAAKVLSSRARCR